MRVRDSAREVFQVVRKIKSIDKVPRNATDDERQSQIWLMRCAKKDSFCGGVKKSEKERKRVKRADKREKISSKFFRVFFVRHQSFFVLSRLSLSPLSLTKKLYSKNRHRRKVEKKKKRSTKYFFVEGVSLSSGEIYDSNAQNRFRMAPRRLDRRSERVFHFQRTVERISRRARKEEYE